MEKLKTAYSAHPAFIGSDFERQVTAFAHHETLSTLEDRLPALLDHALSDLTRSGRRPVTAYTVALCMPEPCTLEAVPQERLQVLGDALKIQVATYIMVQGWPPPDHINVLYEGQTGPTRAIAEMIDATDHSLCLIALDSYNDPERLLALDSQQRLFSKRQPYGLVPGEASVALLLVPEQTNNWQPICQILACATAHEPIGEFEDADSLFEGMSACLQAAADALQSPLAAVLTCPSSEHLAQLAV